MTDNLRELQPGDFGTVTTLEKDDGRTMDIDTDNPDHVYIEIATRDKQGKPKGWANYFLDEQEARQLKALLDAWLKRWDA